MPNRQSYQQYTVAKGDTLAAIAKRFGATVQAIAATSGIADPNKIKVGQVLSIPVATGYDPDDLELSEVKVTAKVAAMKSSPKMDPRAAPADSSPGTALGLAAWFQPPKLWFTMGVIATVAYTLLEGGRRR